MALKVGELFASFSIDSSSVGSAVAQIEQSCNSVGSSMMTSGAAMTAAITAPIIKAAKDMYNAGTDFDAQMSKVFAIRGLDKDLEKDASAMEALRAKAIELGSSTEWTATQAGEALQYMAMAGWSTDAMLKGLTPVMHLASAAGADLGTTSDIVTDAMTAFGLTLENAKKDGHDFSEDVEHFTDVLAAAATNSNTNVELLGTSFRYVAPLAGTLGMNVDDVAVALGLMANNGIKSTTAGASLRNILTGLTGNTKKTAAACEALGLSLTDERGEMKSLSTIMGDLRGAYKQHNGEVDSMRNTLTKLDEKLAEGKISQKEYEEAIDAATAGSSDFLKQCVALAGKQGLSGLLAIMASSDDDFDALSKAIENCDGATDKMAATMLDNAKGAVTIFKSACEGLSITLWDLYKDKFQGIVEKATAMIQKFQKLDSKTQKTYMKFAALSAAAGPVLVIAGKIVKTLPKLAKAISALTSPMGLAVAALALFAVAAVDADNTIGRTMEDMANKAKDKLDAFSKTIDEKIGAVGDRMPALIQSIIKSINTLVPKLFEVGTKIITGIMDAITKNADMLADLGTTIITTLVNGIASSLPSLIPSAVNMVVSLASAIISNIPKLADAALKLIDGFKEGIANIDFADVGQKILTAIETAISGLDKVFTDWFTSSSETAKTQDWASIGSTIIDLILKATTGLADGAATLITNICNALNDHDWSKDGAILQTVAEKLITGIKDAIPKVADVAVKIVGAIASLFTEEGAATQIMKAASGIAETLIKSISDAIPSVAGAAVQIIGKIGELLSSDSTQAFIDSAIQTATNIINAIVEAIPKVTTAAVDIITALAGLFTDDGAATKLMTAAEKIASSLIKAITDAIPGVVNGAVSIITKIGELLNSDQTNSFLNAAKTVATNLIKSLVEAIPKVAKGAVDIINAIGSMFTSNKESGGLVEAAGSIATSLIGSIADAIPAAITGITDIAKALIENIVKILPTVFNEGGKVISAGVKIASELVKNIGEGFKGGIDIDFAGVVQALVNGIVEAISNLPALVGDVLSVGAQIANSLMGSLATSLEDIEGSGIATSLGTALANLVKGLFGAVTDFTGDDNVKGFIENLGRGIIAALGTIGETLGSFVGELLKYLFSEEGLKRIFEAGKNVIELLIKGIEAGVSGIFSFAFNVIDGILEGLGILDPEVKRAYEEALNTGEAYKETIQEAFKDGFYWDEGDIDVGDVNKAILEAFALRMTGAEYDSAAFSDLAASLKEKISEHLGYAISEDSAGYHFERIMGEVVDQLVQAANGARFGEGEFSGLDVQNILGPFLDEFGAGAESLSPELYDTIAKYLLEGGTEGQNELLATIIASILGEPDSPEVQATCDEAEAAIQEIFGDITGSATEAAGSAQQSIDGLNISWDSLFSSSLSEVSAWRTDLEAALSEMGASAGSLLGVALPAGVAEGLATGQMSVEQAAAAIVAAAAAADADVKSAQEKNKTAGESTAGGYSTGVEGEKTDAETAMKGVVDATVAKTDGLDETMKAASEAGMTGFTGGITGSVGAAEGAALTVSDAVVQKFLADMSAENGKTIGEAYVNGVIEGLGTPDISTAATGVADNAYNPLNDKLTSTNGKTIGEAFTGAVKEAFDNANEPTMKAAETMATGAKGKVDTNLNATTGKKAGRDFALGIMAGLGEPRGMIAEIAKNICDTVKTIASSLLSSWAGLSIGLQFAYGIASGISAGTSSVVNAIIAVAKKAVTAAKKELEIKSPSRVARDEIGMMFDKGLVEGLTSGINLVENAATNVSDSMRDSFYISDPSKGTVSTSRQQARMTANETAAAASRTDALYERAERIGRVIADRLIESGVLESDITMDGTAVGKKTAAPVSKEISRKTKQSVKGRSLQGVIA